MNEKEKKAIERCNQLRQVEHANWIGISNQLAIITVLNLLEKKDKIIDLMAEQLTTPVHSKECVIEYFNQKIEKGE